MLRRADALAQSQPALARARARAAGFRALAGYDGVVVAASIILDRHQAHIREFARRHAGQLNGMRSAFVSISGSASGDPVHAQAYIDGFIRRTGWRPTIARSFAGAVAYTQYNVLVRWMLQRISRRKPRSTRAARARSSSGPGGRYPGR